MSFTVFVCSTFSDLSEEREGVLDAIRRLKAQHDSMEFFGARAKQPIETCLQEVRASDALVVIVGHRYGSMVPGLGISFSEAEYAEGFSLKKPCLVYLRDDNVPILPKHMEPGGEKWELLKRWKEMLQARHTVARFQDGRRLAVQVAADLARTIQDLEKAAKTRATARVDDRRALPSEVERVISDALGKGVPEASLLSVIRSSVSSLLVAMRKRAPSAYLSYAPADGSIARRVGVGLVKAGVNVVGLDPEVVTTPGTRWMIQEVERDLSAADGVVVFISPNFVKSVRAMHTLQVALHRQVSGERGGAILPVLLRDADVPPLLRNIQYVDLRGGNIEKGIVLLTWTIQHRAAERQA